MIDNAFRTVLPQWTAPVLRLYDSVGLTPNGVSLLGFGIASAAAVCIAADWPIAAIGLWWIGRLADGTDGIYARATGQASPFGAYFDIVLDMASYSVVILGFAYRVPDLAGAWIVIVFLYVLCITSALALGMLEAEREAPERDDRGLRLGAGLAEGGETGIAYTVFLLFPSQLGWLVWVWVAVLATTVVLRTLLARRVLAG